MSNLRPKMNESKRIASNSNIFWAHNKSQDLKQSAQNPQQLQEDIAGHLSRQIQVMMEFKSKHVTIPVSAVPTDTDQKSGSVMYLDKLVGAEGSNEDKLQRFMKSHELNTTLYDKDFEKVMLAALAQEQYYQQQQFVTFYHGANTLSGIISDICTEVQKIINIQNDELFRHFRLAETSFQTLSSLQDFLTQFQDVVDHDPKYRAVAMCVNPYLFGNHHRAGECTYYYFASNSSIAFSVDDPFKEQGLFAKFLHNIGMNKIQLIQILKDLNNLAKIMLKHGGRLFQIHAHQDVVDQLFYPAHPMGPPIEKKGISDKEHVSMKKMLTAATTGELTDDEVFSLQARFFMHPDIINDPKKVQIKSYFHHPLSKQESLNYTNIIRQVAAAMTGTILYQTNSEKIFLKPKSLPHCFRILKASFLRGYSTFKPNLHLEYLLQTKSFDQIPHFLRHWPELVNLEQLKLHLFTKDQSINDNDLSELIAIFLETQSEQFITEFIKLLNEQKHLIIKYSRFDVLLKCLQITKNANINLMPILQANKKLFEENEIGLVNMAYLLGNKELAWNFINSFGENLKKVINTAEANNQILVNILHLIPMSCHTKLLDQLASHLNNIVSTGGNFMLLFAALSPDCRLKLLINLEDNAYQLFEENFANIFLYIPDNDKVPFFKKYVTSAGIFNWIMRAFFADNNANLKTLIDFLGREDLDFSFRLNNLSDTINIFRRLTGNTLNETKSANEFDSLMAFTQTYLLAENKNNVSLEVLFNLFFKLIDPNYLMKIVNDTHKQQLFIEKIPAPFVVRMHEFLNLPNWGQVSPTIKL